MSLSVIIMAGGIGKRMKSAKVKVLHPLLAKPIISYVIETVKKLSPDRSVLVYGKSGSSIKSLFPELEYAFQPEPLGTGDAVKKGMELLADFSGDVVILSGDVPLLRGETLKNLVNLHLSQDNTATILTTKMKNPYGYGRIVRDGERILKIAEEVDADDNIRAIKEINTGIYVFNARALKDSLNKLQPDNKQKEYYLTDVIGILRRQAFRIGGYIAEEDECKGINTRKDIAVLTKILLLRVFDKLYNNGVTIEMPDTTYIESGVEIGKDTVIEASCVIKGNTKIGSGAVIGAFSYLENAVIPDGRVVSPYSHIKGENG